MHISLIILLIIPMVLTACQPPEYVIEDEWMTLNLEGFQQTCTFQPRLFVKENGNWQSVPGTETLNDIGWYYLDGELHSSDMCDLIECYEIIEPIQVRLTTFQVMGVGDIPDDTGRTASYFEAMPLTGTIKVEFEYFTDKQCRNPQIFSTIIEK